VHICGQNNTYLLAKLLQALRSVSKLLYPGFKAGDGAGDQFVDAKEMLVLRCIDSIANNLS
jgi:hypothetical protein